MLSCRLSCRRLFWVRHVSSATSATPVAGKDSRRQKAPTDFPPLTTLDYSVVQEHLRQVTSRSEITVNDLESCRPSRHSNPDSDAYAIEYRGLVTELLRRFSAKQLRHFVLDEYHLSGSRCRNKTSYARKIIEDQWKWPSLSKIEEKRKFWTVQSSQEHPITPREFFFALGKDGAGLRELSQEFDVHISPLTNSASRIKSLQLEGVQGSIDQLVARLSSLNKDIDERILHLPRNTSLPSTMILKISRLSEAMLETLPSGSLRIVYRRSKPRTALLAERLATRYIANASVQSDLRIHTSLKESESLPMPQLLFPTNYSLYPFFTVHRSPWNIEADGLFRVRRVGEWGRTSSSSENVLLSGGLIGGKGVLGDIKGNNYDLRQSLLLDEHCKPLDDSEQRISALFGHHLIATRSRNRSLIIPPLTGSMPLSRILSWMNLHSPSTAFVPSAPFSSPEPSPESQLHLLRLEYRLRDQAQSSSVPHLVRLEAFSPVSPDTADSVPRYDSALMAKSFQSPLECRLWIGREKQIDLMMPERAMDIKLTMSDGKFIKLDDCSVDITEYASKLEPSAIIGGIEGMPDPPLSIEIFGETYSLYSNVRLLRSVNQATNMIDDSNMNVINETRTDVDSEQGMATTQVECPKILSESAWNAFLRNCDWLSTASERDRMANSSDLTALNKSLFA